MESCKHTMVGGININKTTCALCLGYEQTGGQGIGNRGAPSWLANSVQMAIRTQFYTKRYTESELQDHMPKGSHDKNFTTSLKGRRLIQNSHEGSQSRRG
jgi:hypothetical protein